MSDLEIQCPHCGESFELTDAIAAPLVAEERRKVEAAAERQVETERHAIEARARESVAAEYAEQLAARDMQVQQAREAELAARKAKEQAEQAQRDTELEVQRRVDAERKKIAATAASTATADAAAKLAEAERTIAEKDAKLEEARARELEALRVKAEAEEQKRETELTVARRVDEETARVREQALKERDEEFRLKTADKDRQLAALLEQVEELRRKADQGPQQQRGDVAEVDLVEVLLSAFPQDEVTRVRRGVRGADVLQIVFTPNGTRCGSILWETKRTKSWIDGWLNKLREDQREAKADLAVIASETLPAGVQTFAEIDRVWVTSLATVVPVAAALRHGLLETAAARRAGALTDSSKDAVFGYLISAQFRQRVERIVETYRDLRSDLDHEKRAAARLWATREKQLDRVLGGIAGIYGDLRGLVGTTLPTVAGLEYDGAAAEPDRAAVVPLRVAESPPPSAS
ncbi:MAG: DUF2130 domain-containing protein [Dehalococcoidia bacterium]